MPFNQSIVPSHASEWEDAEDEKSTQAIRVITEFSGDAIKKFCGVMVFTWDHKNYGRGKRAYLSTFTEPERKKLSALHNRAYGWQMRTGYPRYVRISLSTYQLLVRVGNFFASI